MTDLENPILKNVESGQIIEVIKSPVNISNSYYFIIIITLEGTVYL